MSGPVNHIPLANGGAHTYIATEYAVKSRIVVGPMTKCPKCDSPEVQRSHRRGLGDHLISLIFLRPFRCRRCYHRFYWFSLVKADDA